MPPCRIVSLVPSETFNLFALGAIDKLVGRTRYCIQPPSLDHVPQVGGTKNLRVDEVINLAPDLVLANREENSRDNVTRLLDAGLEVRLTFPKTVREGLEDLLELAQRLDAEACPIAVQARTMLASLASSSEAGPTCFVPIWGKPWMTINGDTYIADVLRVLGLRNVFEELPSMVDGRDSRYPVVEMQEVIARAPEVILLPDEPYPFSDRHAARLRELPLPAASAGRIVCISGQDLSWHGAWAIGGLARLREELVRGGLFAD